MLLPILISCLSALVAASYNNAEDACQRFKVLIPNSTVVLPNDARYEILSTENWSATAWGSPICVVEPATTADVQQIVSLLNQQQVQFAIRSGGHMPSPLGSNSKDGVLIDLTALNKLAYYPSSSTLEVGAGRLLRDIYDFLDPYKATIVGARVLDVGVGGSTLGSGLSYLSDLYGMACDNVVNFEVVLANGSAINANATSNQNLFWALKGGANNFGVVTSFTLRTYPINAVWGGNKMYAAEQLPALYTALAEYQANPNKDPYANLMLQPFATNKSLGAALNLVYLKPEAAPAAFKPFYSIPTVADNTQLQTLNEMISGQLVPEIPRWDWFTTSFTPSKAIYDKISALVDSAPETKQLAAISSGTLVLGFQPISSSLVRAGIERGRNALGLKETNQTWLVLDIGWWNPEDDKIAHSATKSLIAKIENITKAANAYLPYIFMNDASWDQPVIQHYGTENLAKIKKVQSEYDPTLAFQKLVRGGFKIPSK